MSVLVGFVYLFDVRGVKVVVFIRVATVKSAEINEFTTCLCAHVRDDG